MKMANGSSDVNGLNQSLAGYTVSDIAIVLWIIS